MSCFVAIHRGRDESERVELRGKQGNEGGRGKGGESAREIDRTRVKNNPLGDRVYRWIVSRILPTVRDSSIDAVQLKT